MCFRPAGLAPFPLKCPECGTFNKPGNEVCQKCDFDLTEAWEAAIAEKMAAQGGGDAAPMQGAPTAPGAAAPTAPGAPKAPSAPASPK
jgi:hypothetical protein